MTKEQSRKRLDLELNWSFWFFPNTDKSVVELVYENRKQKKRHYASDSYIGYFLDSA